MKANLRQEDRQAVDLLLDRGALAAGKATAVFSAADSGTRERVGHVQKVLQLLDAMPTPEPSKDLMARTMEFIESAGRTGRNARPNRATMSTLAQQPPVA